MMGSIRLFESPGRYSKAFISLGRIASVGMYTPLPGGISVPLVHVACRYDNLISIAALETCHSRAKRSMTVSLTGTLISAKSDST